MKKEIIFLLVQYLILALLLVLVSCTAIPEVTARVEINSCGENVQITDSTFQNVYPGLEITFDNGSIKLSSDNLCFSFYLFNANRDTLYNRSFKIIGKNHIELFNILNQ